MALHIGIVACSAEGAALCYRTIALEGVQLMGRHSHPEITMHTYPLSDYMRFADAGNWRGVADLMVSSAEKVAKAGADFIICPDNTIHQVFDLVAAKSPLPWLHIADQVAAEAKRHNYRCLGVLGTRYLMEGPVYSERLAKLKMDSITPEPNDRRQIDTIIFDELVNGHFTNRSKAYFIEVIERLKKAGCDAVVLGCTEIPLLISQEDSPLPVLDSTRILARAALRRATKAES